MNLGIVTQWSESVDQEAVSSTKRSSRSSSRRLCLHFRLQQAGSAAKWPSAGTYALKAGHRTRLRRALGSQVFQTGVACWLIKSTSASHLLTSSPAWTSARRMEVKRWPSMASATTPLSWGEQPRLWGCWYHHWRAPVCPWQFILGLWCILYIIICFRFQFHMELVSD